MSMEESIRRIIREENEKHLRDIECMLESHGYRQAPKMLSVAEAAKILKMGKTAVYELCRQKEFNGFPAFQEVFNSPIRIPYNALMNWIDEQSKHVV